MIESNGRDEPVSAIYDKVATYLSICPVAEGGSLKISHWYGHAILRRYRVLDDGSYELSPIDSIHRVHTDDFSTSAQEDPAFAAFYSGLMALIQEYVDAKGL